MFPKPALRSTVTRRAPNSSVNSSVVMTQMQTEQNHANVEKDLLAIAYACDIFNQDLYGRSNVIAEQP